MIITRQQKMAMLATDSQMLLGAIKRRVLKDYSAIVEGVPDDLLTAMIQHGIGKAKSFGLVNPSDIAGFVYILFEVGPEFYRHPKIQSVLSDPAIPPENKMNAMLEQTPPEAWQQCVDVLGRQTWFPELRSPAE